MKNFLLGILFAVIFSGSIHYHWMSDGRFEKQAFFIENQILQGNYLLDPLTGRCSTEVSREFEDKDGILKKQTEADYFQCDKFQRLINLD